MTKTVTTVLIPIGFGVAAALFNLMAVRTATRTVDLAIAKSDLKAGTELTEDMIGKLTVRTDKEVFRTAVRYEDRGAIVGRKIRRPLTKSEALLLVDVRLSGSFDVQSNLKGKERTLTLSVKPGRVVPGLSVDDWVEVVIAAGADDGDEPPPKSTARPGRVVGPFRVVGLADRAEGATGSFRGDERQVVIAYTPGDKNFSLLEKAYRGDSGDRIVGVEYANEKR